MKQQPIRVLLADPEQQLLSAYRSFLESQGLEVATASCGEECLSKLGDWKPDVLVLEPETPQRWGEEVLAKLRHPDERRVPVLVLSKRDRGSTTYPVREYHVKPMPMAELVRSIYAAFADSCGEGPQETDLLSDERERQTGGA